MAQQFGLGGPINYYGMIPDFRQEALQETQNRVGQQQVINSQIQNAQMQKENQRRSQFFQAMASATPEQLPSLRQQYPEFADTIQKEIGVQDADHAQFVNKALGKLSVAMQSGDPAQIGQALQAGAPVWGSLGTSAEAIGSLIQKDPQQASALLNSAYMSTLPFDKQADIQTKRDVLQENIRSNKASEGLTARGQDISRENSIRASNGASSVPASVREYEYFNKLSPEQQERYLKVRGRGGDSPGGRQVQLSDGRTVTIDGKLHGAGQNAFYEGTDSAGNTIRVPAASISAPATSAATAQNYAMKKDLDLIENATDNDLSFMTGITGGNGAPAVGADVRSRLSGGDQRKLYNATQRIQGRMQNQGIAAARDMGASGINTVAEAKMYFQGMPQLDFSSPGATKQTMKDIREYTDNYNQQYDVNLSGKNQPAQQQQEPVRSGTYTSKSGIQFKVE